MIITEVIAYGRQFKQIITLFLKYNLKALKCTNQQTFVNSSNKATSKESAYSNKIAFQ